MHDDGLHPDAAQKHDVFGEGSTELGVDHRISAELHDDDGSAEPVDIRQRLDQGLRPLRGFKAPVRDVLCCGFTHDRYPPFASLTNQVSAAPNLQHSLVLMIYTPR